MAEWYANPNVYYNTLPPITEHDARSSVGVNPIADAADLYERYSFYIWCRQNGCWIEEVIGDSSAQQHARLEFSPIQRIDADYPPALLLHGSLDDDVPCEESRAMAKAHERANVPHELFIVNGAGHLFDAQVEGVPPAGMTAVGKVLQFMQSLER